MTELALANKTVAGSVSTDKPVEVWDRPAGSQENSEKRLHILHDMHRLKRN